MHDYLQITPPRLELLGVRNTKSQGHLGGTLHPSPPKIACPQAIAFQGVATPVHFPMRNPHWVALSKRLSSP